MRRRAVWLEGLGLLALAGLAMFFVATSWRKWPDPLVDFGRELYIPWRLAHGAVLYRDVDDFYGPLSQYANAGLFALFGPGLMVLVAANLAVFTAILAAVYLLFRRAWGAGAALAASACFVSVFGFSQFVGGNFNYATPYAHEATQGVLVCLLLVAALLRWVDGPAPGRSFVAGLLLGLSAVLKPEILLAAALVVGAALVLGRRSGRPFRPAAAAAGALGALLPSAVFAVYFSTRMPWRSAAACAGRAWLSVFATTRFTGEMLQTGFLGFDRPWAHLAGQAGATALGLLVLVGIGFAARGIERAGAGRLRWVLGAALVAAVGALAWFGIDWIGTGRCLLGLVLVYLGFLAADLVRGRVEEIGSPTFGARLLLGVLAAALMARMVLNGRIYQFGFYQAALAGVLVPAVLIGELAGRCGGGRRARGLVGVCALALLGPGVFRLAGASQRLLGLKTLAIGEGRDRFYALPANLDPTGEIVRQISVGLGETSPDQTVLVLPEGEMINYLARRRSPVAPFFFFSAAISGGREEQIVRDLRRNPPDWVVIVSRDLREYGVTRYGEAPGKGAAIMEWVDENYRLAGSVGGDPLDPRERGGVVLGRR